MGRWTDEEEVLLDEMKNLINSELEETTQFPEVVGDRRLIRFLRGCNHDVNRTVNTIRKFLAWRRENGVDKYTLAKFPHGEMILDLFPQIVIAANARDKNGNPVAIEHYSFSAKAAAAKVEEFSLFLIYALEYRTLILEQLSYERERQIIAQHIANSTEPNGYGQVLRLCFFRDLKGLGSDFLSSDMKMIFQRIMTISKENYTEILGKSHVVNAPWLFNLIWKFMKTILDANTVAKVAIYGHDFTNDVLQDISFENLPRRFGGGFEGDNEPFAFDTSEGGPLHYPGAPPPTNRLPRSPTASTSALTGDDSSEDDHTVPQRSPLSMSTSTSTSTFPPSPSQSSPLIRRFSDQPMISSPLVSPQKHLSESTPNTTTTSCSPVASPIGTPPPPATSRKKLAPTSLVNVASDGRATGGVLSTLLTCSIWSLLEACWHHPLLFLVVLPLILHSLYNQSPLLLLAPVLSTLFFVVIVSIME